MNAGTNTTDIETEKMKQGDHGGTNKDIPIRAGNQPTGKEAGRSDNVDQVGVRSTQPTLKERQLTILHEHGLLPSAQDPLASGPGNGAGGIPGLDIFLHVLYLFTVQTEICKPKRAGCELHSFIYVQCNMHTLL